MILENNDCDLECEGCELEAVPMQCLDFFCSDIEAIKEQQQNDDQGNNDDYTT